LTTFQIIALVILVPMWLWVIWRFIHPPPMRFSALVQCQWCGGVESPGEGTVEDYKVFFVGFKERHRKCREAGLTDDT
jgi:hypothetical protein